MTRTSAGAQRALRAFTLVELLVVVSIIALLISILLPSLSNARKQAKTLVCQTRMRNLSSANFTYLSEFGSFAPSISNFSDSNNSAFKAKRYQAGVDWLGLGDQTGPFNAGVPNNPTTGNPKGFADAPRLGALWPYVRDEKAYLCPEDVPGLVEKGTLLGGGGNGKFSYSIFSILGMRTPDTIITRYRETSGGSRGGPKLTRLPKLALSAVPIFVEEHPDGINDRTSSTAHMEGNFNYETDYVVSRHVPAGKRLAIRGGAMTSMVQGSTNIGFCDGHVEPLQVNFGFKLANAKASGGIGDTADALLYHFGIESNEAYVIDAATGKPACEDPSRTCP